MNLLIIGAAGKTGKLIAERAVAAGHAVTAFVRDPARFSATAGVRVIAGDATDSVALSQAMVGQDAVVDTVGGKTPWKRTTLERTVAAAVVSAMKTAGTKRLILVSALGVGDSVAQSPLLFRYVFLPTFLRGSTADKFAAEQLIRDSGLQYVMVRPAILTDNPATGNVRVFSGSEKAGKIARADVAQFVVEQLLSDEYLGRAVTIATSWPL